MAPKTQYARNGDANIAYQVAGEGPSDLVIVSGFVSHLEMDWGSPENARFFERLSSFCRLIRFDKRGTGLSDPVFGVPTLEERMEDARAVMDAVGSKRATLLGYSEGGSMSVLFAATYPERTAGLIIYGSFPNGAALASSSGDLVRMVRNYLQNWGEGHSVDLFAPSIAGDPEQKALIGVYERSAASPRMARGIMAAVDETDVTDVLPNVRVPTLVLHRRDEAIPIEGAREMAKQIPDARFVELEGSDHWMHIGDSAAILGEIEEFVTGTRHAPVAERALATVMFTDIVGSTERAGELGDTGWRQVLERHNELTRKLVERSGGRPIKSTGDGYLATFDGPTRAVNCASDLTEAVRPLEIEIRAGIHTGECEFIGDDIAGMAVHIGARVSATADAGEVVVSSTVKDLVVGSGIQFEDRGERELKGVPGSWRLYLVGKEADSPAEPVAVPSV
ncbi:MAG: adenylate/guanylate cyclase domain-containing protein [Thermoleophilia bacterium]|nr:adenylate/guanylate cyclase domain-containing protein [Thermoleophilia bacterium]